MQYSVPETLVLPGLANPRYADLNQKEIKRGHRVIGGDKGDLHFEGFELDEKNNLTKLVNPVLVIGYELTPDEVVDIANEVLMFSFESVGLETVEHS